MSNCIFCKIATGDMAAKTVAETDDLVAFRDVNPQAPVHVLIIPRKHVATLNDLTPDDAAMVGKMFLLAAEIAKKEKIDQSGYRTVFNTNKDGAQSVFHVHLHVLGGRALAWPPG